ncbi:hypothetical protein MPDQ_006587 [Monascus purpureus]|uniref:O-acyltransferase n=1 Tax=Monascus purpureus TaxID=5098 RepID=A0A507R2V8_MONPU|nr:hypothetical protein MPDQ_006587 [Monascus purpureus]BDD60701.1 hypothetical protein MAP00_005800 [Monascus purpureus]
MSTAVSHPTGSPVLRPRATKKEFKENQEPTKTPSSSGQSTPVPDDAPPSAHVLSQARKQTRARRIFYSIDYTPRVSYLDPRSDYHKFGGFFNLFWIGLPIMFFTKVARNYKETGNMLLTGPWSLLVANIWSLALSDLAMVSTTALSLPLHRLYRNSNGWLRWSRGGIVVQSLYELGWFILWVNWPFMLQWTWTAQVFFMLHTLTFLMKMHSYAFYNGHLSESQRRLADLDKPNPKTTSMSAAVRYPETASGTRPPKEKHHDNCHHDGDFLAQLREDLAMELTSPLGRVTYPQNLTWLNYLDYAFCPTICYEIEYPRSEGRSWSEVAIKVLAVFGCIFFLILLSGEFITPVLIDAQLEIREARSPSETALILAETISMLMFPFMIAFLLVFLVIFEYVLGAFAEITRFADRKFYSDWWNSCDWLEFSSEWNIPVHHFLRRHVYFPTKIHFSKPVAMFVTFFLSSVAHELVMSCITHKMRWYGFSLMMCQLPITSIQKSKIFRGHKTMKNVLFWYSMILGLAMMCTLYVLV